MIDDVTLILSGPEAFYTDANQKVYRAVLALRREGKPVELVTLRERLHAAGEFADVRGAYLMELWDAANAEYYARIVREKWICRNIIHVCNEVLRDAYEPLSSADDFLADAERAILAIGERGATAEVKTLQDFLIAAATRYDNRAANREPPGLPTGLAEFDEATTGFKPAETIVLAARPSVGKTALGLQILNHVCLDVGTPAFLASLEMPGMDIADRTTCLVARIDDRLVRAGRMPDGGLCAMLRAHDALAAARLFVDDMPEQTVSRIAANARRLKRRENIGLVVIDYLEIIPRAEFSIQSWRA